MADSAVGKDKCGEQRLVSLPLSRIRVIMKSSPEVSSINQEALVLTAKATVSGQRGGERGGHGHQPPLGLRTLLAFGCPAGAGRLGLSVRLRVTHPLSLGLSSAHCAAPAVLCAAFALNHFAPRVLCVPPTASLPPCFARVRSFVRLRELTRVYIAQEGYFFSVANYLQSDAGVLEASRTACKDV